MHQYRKHAVYYYGLCNLNSETKKKIILIIFLLKLKLIIFMLKLKLIKQAKEIQLYHLFSLELG